MSEGRYVALLRGVNVGGKNRLPMQRLLAILVAAGCRDVRTYIQSGNVVFRMDDVSGLTATVESAITAELGIQVPVVLRSATEMAQAVAANPYLEAGVLEELLHVSFLKEMPSPGNVARLDCDRSPGDAFFVTGREIYLHLPYGVARTKLTNGYFDTVLGTISTQRNWRTVKTLAAMAAVSGSL